ncbi:M4 family metallopeptidase [Myxococcus stipitatus]|uniref:M4 family metallopeptidase n=1 Tax=Myxococcus stipitatus TaxID=83455 RepID=UPI001F3455E8|nr:M4 family metallopeptidase [Myxococcus stipitatus]MCE9668087.1 M4 family metallopeptidase [Myxococcus stipitatus]
MKLPWSMNNSWMRSLVVVVSSVVATACHEPGAAPDEDVVEPQPTTDADVTEALRRLPDAHVLGVGAAGTPNFVRGDLGKLEGALEDRSTLERIAPVFRLTPQDLEVTRVTSDELGFRHVYYSQTKNRLPVVGGELAVHVNAEGVIYAAHGTARDGVQLPVAPLVPAEGAERAVRDDSQDISSVEVGPARLVYLHALDGRMVLTWEQAVMGLRGQDPVHDVVYVDAQSGAVVERHPRIHSARSRKIHDLAHGTTLPGAVARNEGAPSVADPVVNQNYDRLGDTYDCYKTLFNWDSFDNQGSTLISSVHYGENYANAFWNGIQMVFGDGDGVRSANMTQSLDITAHELTHAVIQRTANLVYAGEPGGLNESIADIFGNVCESFREGAVTSKTWMVGEDVWSPAIPGDALRYMNDPRQDGVSIDHYLDYNTGMDVHFSSGIPNLAFHLLVQGGTHPRGRSTVSVPGIGLPKARYIWFRALTLYMTAGTDFLGARNATRQAAADVLPSSDVDAVERSWRAVGVPPVTPLPANVLALSNGIPVANLSGATGNKQFFSLEVPADEPELVFELSGGAGDADMYVKFGATPGLSQNECRASLAGTSETCRITNPVPGTWYVLVHAHTGYSGVTLRGAYSNPPELAAPLTNGVPLPNLSGAAGSKAYWKMWVPAGQARVTFSLSGAAGVSGDADLYVRRGAAPTLTTFDCAPRLQGNSETCTINNPAEGEYYVMVHGYVGYSVLTLSGQYP